MIYYFEFIVSSGELISVGTLGRARNLPLADLTIVSVAVTRDTLKFGGDVEFDVRAGSPGGEVSIYATPEERPRLAPGEYQVIQTGLDAPVDSLASLSIIATSVPLGGGGSRFTAIIGVSDGQTAITDEALQDKIAEFLVAGTNVNINYDDSGNTITISSTDTTVTPEDIQDIVAAMLEQGANVTLTYDDASNTLSVAASGGGAALPPGDVNPATNVLETIGGVAVNEYIQDLVGGMFTPGANISFNYNDATGKLELDAIQLTTEEVQDKVGALLSGGANTTVTYNDGANTLTIAETTAGATTEEIQDIVAGLLTQGTNVTLTYNDGSNTLTIAASGGGGGTTAFELIVAASDEGTNITTGNAKVTFRAPVAFTLTTIKASLSVASTSGIPAYRVNKNGTTIFSTNLTIDATEKTSKTAATPFVFTGGTNPAIAEDDEITIDVVTAGTGTRGLKITFIGTR